MNAKSLALSIFSSLSFISFVAMAQPAAAEVSFEIISGSGDSSTELSNDLNTRSTFQPTSTAREIDQRENAPQSDSNHSLEREQSNSSESSKDDFEGIVIRI